MAEEDAVGSTALAATELRRTLEDIRRTSRGISGDLADGLKDAVVEGEKLDEVLTGIAQRFTGRFLDQALAPLERLVAQGIGGAVGGVLGHGGGFGGAAGPAGRAALGGGGGVAGSAPAAPSPVNVTFNVTSPDAEGFRRSEARVTAMLARASARGRRQTGSW